MGENKVYKSDYIVRATAAKGQVRAFAITSQAIVEEARDIHNTSPVATAALGRLLSAGAMMGAMMKGDKDLLTLQIKGAGPIGGIIVTADANGNVKGYVNNPNVLIGANQQGKLDVAAAIGAGVLSVIKDMGLKEPYIGQTELQTGEIAEDLTYYFVTSEQVPSAVALGVLMNKNNTVKQAGGFIIQMMPFAEEEVIANVEKNLAKITSVTELLDQGKSPEQILELIFDGMSLEINDTMDCQFHCNCSKERVEKAVMSIGKKDINEMINDGKPIEVNCHFCNKHYQFNIDELKKML